MSELKTKVTSINPIDFIETLEDKQKKDDSLVLLKIFKQVTKEKPKMWGTSIIGFGMYHYKSERSTQEGDWPLIAFSPRKQNLTLYLMSGINQYNELFKTLGKYKTSVSCLYIKKLSDINLEILQKIIALSFSQATQELANK